MAEKNDTRVLVKGKVLTISGFEPADYQQKVANYINDKYADCERLDGYRFLNSETKSILLELNIADDYFKAKSHLEVLEIEFEQKSKELNALKQELAATKAKLDTAKSQVAELQQNAADNAAKIIHLETELKKRQQ